MTILAHQTLAENSGNQFSDIFPGIGNRVLVTFCYRNSKHKFSGPGYVFTSLLATFLHIANTLFFNDQ